MSSDEQVNFLVEDREMNLERIKKLEQEIKELMNSVDHERTLRQRKERVLKMEIKAMEKQMENLELENAALREQVPILKPIETPKITIGDKDLTPEEIEVKNAIRNFHPRNWEFLESLISDFPLTVGVLQALIEKKEIKLVILAMSLMTDHTVCLQIVKKLAEKKIVDIDYKREGDLNPTIKLRYSE